mmetsp:Transcript_45389/g.82953  ORF Transcript_45389/g.82953 Transcript_45389/m.82953 type:complete len:598 (+) Transcript_45389:99-1892(+)
MQNSEEELASVRSIVLTTSLLLIIVIGYYINTHRIRHVPESGATIVLGFVVGLLIRALSDEEEQSLLDFRPEFFFYVLLPPIIFEAGLCLDLEIFLNNVGAILTFAICGTLLSTWVVSNSLLLLARLGVPLGLEPERRGVCCHLFGALISATDPVATMALLGGGRLRADPLVKSLINGESVLNDAVAIVLFKSLWEHLDEESPALFTTDVLGHFFLVSTGSFIFGIIAGCSCSWFFCNARHLELFPDYEIAIMCLCAYLTFALSQLLGMSGIVSLFFFGIVLAHYNWYNLSTPAKVASKVAFKTLASVSESCCFLYLGLVTALALGRFHWNFTLVAVAVGLILFARAAHVFPLSAMLNLQREQHISRNMQIFMWFSGLRGAISFALSLSLPCAAGSPFRRGSPQCVNSDLFLTTTICIVMLTTVVVGTCVERAATVLHIVDIPRRHSLDSSLSVPLASTSCLEDDVSADTGSATWTEREEEPFDATASLERASPKAAYHSQGTGRPSTPLHMMSHSAAQDASHGVSRGLLYEALHQFDARVLRPRFGGPSTQVLRGSTSHADFAELPQLHYFTNQPGLARQVLEEDPPNVSRSAIFE